MPWILLLATTAWQATPPPPPPAPDGPGRWPRKNASRMTDSITCEPNERFSIDLRWRFRKGVDQARIESHGRALPAREAGKLIEVLKGATDLLHVQLGCAGPDGHALITYVDASLGHHAVMRLEAMIRRSTIEIVPPVEARD